MASGRHVIGEEISVDSWPVLAIAGIATILLTLLSLPLGSFALGLLFWLAHILRKPNRVSPDSPSHILAPSDGIILDIQSDYFPNHQHGVDPLPALRITIMTRLSDVQAHLSPISGHVTDNVLLPGLFTKWGDKEASWQAAREINERREIRIRDKYQRDVVLVQFGSLTARQLVCRLREGKFIRAGDHLGMARIAGVCDVYLPQGAISQILAGQHVLAGETILASFAHERKRVPKGAGARSGNV
jgi:phosphatidylserine decarboxylase